MSRSVIPDPLRALPWKMLGPLTLLVCFGSTVLYSAAGGHMWPWGAMHLIHFAVFMVMAAVVSRSGSTEMK